jgi:TolA-binding protein
VMLFAAGMAVSQLDVNYRDGALTVRTRSAEPAAASRNASIQLPAVAGAAEPLPGGAAIAPVAASDSGAPRSAADTEQLLQRVRAMIDQSEIRQQRELALRLSQVAGEVDTQHQADLLRIQQNFGQQQEMMDYLVRTSGGAK